MEFSGKLSKIDNEYLRRLFGPMIPIEAVNLVFDQTNDSTIGSVRAQLEAMSKEWDPALSQLNRLRRSRMALMRGVEDAERRYAEAETPAEKALLVQIFIDAVEVLEAAQDDLSSVMREED